MKKKPPPKPTPAKRKLAREIERVMIPPTRESLLDSLRQITPGAFADGKLDLRRLAEMTGVDGGGSERYLFDWAGRREAAKVLQAQPMGALISHRNESENFDSTRNLYIEGENLGAMKLLHPAYAGRVKMIYIDPPYNTGSDFIYNDDFNCPLRDYWKLCKELNSKGEVNSAKAKDEEKKVNGHRHSLWLSMMYPRLFVARELLRDDGVIFISIDDNEVHHLRLLMNMVFGEENYFATLSFISRTKPTNMGEAMYNIQSNTEYVLAYGKMTMTEYPRFNLIPNVEKKYPHKEKYGDCRHEEIAQRRNTGRLRRDTMVYELLGIPAKENYRWQLSQDAYRHLQETNRIKLIRGKPHKIIYPSDEEGFSHRPFWSHMADTGTSEVGKKELSELIGHSHGFDTVKPMDLVKKMLFHTTKGDDIVLDFFSGSATTAHAVMALNAEDGGTRRCISIQIPEPCDAKSEATKAGYKTIADIGKERIRRAAQKIRAQIDAAEKKESGQKKIEREESERKESAAPLDLGFRVFQLAHSNFQQWQPPAEKTADEWKKATEKMTLPLSSADTEAMLFEIMLAEGYPPDSAVEKVRAKGNAVHKISHPDGDRVMHVCLDKKLVEGIPDALGIGEDDKFICRDDALNDILATNLALRCKVKVV